MMSNQAILWGCALAAVVGLRTGNQLSAQEAAVTNLPAWQTADAAAERINAALDLRLKTPLRYEEEQLDIILATIADEYELPIIFDKAALDEVAISQESEVSINVQNISLRSALRLMLREPGLEELCFVVDAEVLIVTTNEKANENISVQVYRVDDLLHASTSRLNASHQYGDPEQLINLIVSIVAHDSWQVNCTGEGELRFCPPGMLVISQTRRVHDQVEELLGKLRKTKRQIPTANTVAEPGAAATEGFPINVELGENAHQIREELATVIKNSVDWSFAVEPITEQAVSIDVLPELVVVRHAPHVLSQVQTVLSDMRILNPKHNGSDLRQKCDFGRRFGRKAASPDLAEETAADDDGF